VYNQLKIVSGILFAAILVYSGLWYTAAFDAEKKVAEKFSLWRDAGLLIEHGKIEHSGFPYRIMVTIKNVSLSTRARGLQFKADELFLVSHLWTPGHWVAEARDAEGALINATSQFKANSLKASYRLHEGGKIIVVIEPDIEKPFSLPRLMGNSGPDIKAWQLFLQYGDASGSQSSNLYGERFLNFKITGQTVASRLEIMGGVGGPVVKDWRKDQLANWRDEGGLLELDSIDLSSTDGRSKGSASFTLDKRFRPLGSANLMQTGEMKFTEIAKALGLRVSRTGPVSKNGPASLMFQNGEVSLDGTPVAKLKSVVK